MNTFQPSEVDAKGGVRTRSHIWRPTFLNLVYSPLKPKHHRESHSSAPHCSGLIHVFTFILLLLSFTLFLCISSHFHHQQKYAVLSSMALHVLTVFTQGSLIWFQGCFNRAASSFSLFLFSPVSLCKWVRFTNQCATFNTSSAVMNEGIHQRD